MAEPTATSLMYDWSFKSHEECQNYYANVTMDGGVWCNATWDHILCWPPSPPDTQVELPCPPLKGVDPTQMAHRRCTGEGQWQGRVLDAGPEDPTEGWTNYTMCFIPELRQLMDKLYASSEEDAKLSGSEGLIRRKRNKGKKIKKNKKKEKKINKQKEKKKNKQEEEMEYEKNVIEED
ncbi:PDF receptor-like [Penaeus vannamei]|uniref:PDF receptor-like n=1 Tax=Penaeus vannamei TaxID=6689 RepID=UPI00387F72B1